MTDCLKTNWIYFVTVFSLFWGCKPEFEVFAPEKELYAVYGVLHPDREFQYIRISKLYQFEGDAYLYAAENDLTVKGLQMTLTGNDQILESEQMDSVPKDPGAFIQAQTLYRFTTSGNARLIPGKRYDLRITRADDPNFDIQAYTVIPQKPVMESPGEPLLLPDQLITLPSVEFSDDTEVQFFAGNAMGFEVRVFINYLDGNKEGQIRWGPTPVFLGDKGCTGSKFDNEVCYKIPAKSVVRLLGTTVNQANDSIIIVEQPRVTPNSNDLPTACKVEVTAVDTALTNFLASVNPFGFGLNLLMDRPAYSNISGDNTGIFGSINTDENYVFLGSCTKYLSGLINPTIPPRDCE